MHRYRFVGRRILQAIPFALAILLATFMLLAVAPGDPARQVAGLRASPEAVEQVRDDLGLNQPLPEQYRRYLLRVAHGDLGTTTNGSTDVSTLIRQNGPVSAVLIGSALSVAFVVALGLATVSTRRAGWLDRALQTGAAVGLTLPPFWIGILLLVLVAAPTGWFPIGGWGDTFSEKARASVLPSLTLAFALVPVLYRNLRASIAEVRASEYVMAARSLGIAGWELTRRYIWRNALPPAVALLGSLAGFLLSGTVLVEATFGIPGLGQTMVEGALSRDFNVIQGLTLVFAACVLVSNLASDVILVMLDPRVEVR